MGTNDLNFFNYSLWIKWLTFALLLPNLADDVDKFVVVLLKRIENIDDCVELFAFDRAFEAVVGSTYGCGGS